MNNKIIFSAFILSLSTYTYSESSVEQQIFDGCSKLKQYAQLGKKYYDKKQYTKALKQFEYQAAWASFCLYNEEHSGLSLQDNDRIIANNNVGLTYAKLNKPLWAKAWFSLDSDSKISIFNLNKLPLPKKSNDISGTYVRTSGFGQWDTITVTKNKANYEIFFQGYYFPARGLIYGPNMGEFETSMPLSKRHAEFKYEDCEISLDFEFIPTDGHSIAVDQILSESGCGFGHNVWAGGQYFLVED
jgi:hypothetical protein